MNDDFEIIRLSWITEMPCDEPLSSEFIQNFRLGLFNIITFLNDNQLCSMDSNLKNVELNDSDYAIRKSDLTEEGYDVIKNALPKWQKRFDRSKDKSKVVNDLSEFTKELSKN